MAKRGGSRKKIKSRGREATVGLWMDGDVPDMDCNDFQFVKELDMNKVKSMNSMYDKCVCVICCDVIVNCPLVFKECDHGCCRKCFISRFLKTKKDETECPKCCVKSNIKISSLLQSLVAVLRAPCSVCTKPILFESYEDHRRSCQGADQLRILFKEAGKNYVELKTEGQVKNRVPYLTIFVLEFSKI